MDNEMDANQAGTKSIEKIQTSLLRKRIYERLTQLILTLQWRPGHQIVIDQLADELGVSHTPLREALAMLELDGLVVTTHYKNPRVTPIAGADVRNVYEMRVLLEGWAAERAATELPDGKLVEMEEVLLRARKEIGEGHFATHLQSDLFLHDTILRAADNDVFQRLAQLVTNQSVRTRALVEATRGPDTILTIIDEHLGIVDALKARDGKLARERIVVHLQSAMQRTLSALEVIEREE